MDVLCTDDHDQLKKSRADLCTGVCTGILLGISGIQLYDRRFRILEYRSHDTDPADICAAFAGKVSKTVQV